MAISRLENGYLQPSLKVLVRLSKVYRCDVKEFLTESARTIWSHFGTMLLEHVMAQSEGMEEGNLPNMDLNQFVNLSDRMGGFAEVDESEVEETDAQDQMVKEIR